MHERCMGNALSLRMLARKRTGSLFAVVFVIHDRYTSSIFTAPAAREMIAVSPYIGGGRGPIAFEMRLRQIYAVPVAAHY